MCVADMTPAAQRTVISMLGFQGEPKGLIHSLDPPKLGPA